MAEEAEAGRGLFSQVGRKALVTEIKITQILIECTEASSVRSPPTIEGRTTSSQDNHSVVPSVLKEHTVKLHHGSFYLPRVT